MTDTKDVQLSKADWLGALTVIAVLGASVYMWLTDHWQWLLIIPITAAFAFGLIKFGWDAATAVNKKANE